MRRFRTLNSRKGHPDLYGYSVDLISQWCGVTAEIAFGWKNCTRKMPDTALALFKLYAEDRVLTPEFDGFRCVKGSLIPHGGRGFTPAQLEAYELVYQIAMTYARPEIEAHLERMKLLQREQPPPTPPVQILAPRWLWDPFFDPREGARTVLAGTDQDRKD
jgi:hypothetical protein